MLVRAEAAKLDTIRVTVTGVGAVAPSPGADWNISAPEPARVLELPKAENDPVQPGDILARFEFPSLAADIAARQADLAQANARAATAKTNAARLADLAKRGIIPQRDADDAARDLMEAETAARRAASEKDAMDLATTGTVVRARFAGIVARRWHSVGDSVAGDPTDPILRVIDPERLEVVVSLPIAQLALIGPSRPARILNPTDPAAIDGIVIGMPAMDGAAAAGDVRLSFTKTPSMTNGTSVQVEILSEEHANVLVIPTSAVAKGDEGTYVNVAGSDGKAHRKMVSLGLVSQNRVQVISGLAAGDLVILGPEPVPDGAAITIQR